ncbi:hypothetical protein V5O48_004187 [Marasmius crinis-equi]|uniref:Uncharacterized protein n=1 Tax=Marasmius crinis-equi TaxID=585013 RepID=A0ABR3FR76_9AGAR
MAYNQTIIDEYLREELTKKRVILFPTTTLAMTYYFYGMYAVLVTLCISLLRRDRFENRKFYLVSTVLLFVICAMMVIDETMFRVREASLEFTAVKTDDYVEYTRYSLEGNAKTIY